MTVRRYSDDYFNAVPSAVAKAIRSVLARRPPYRQTTELKMDTLFKTNIKRTWWDIGTEMTISIEHSLGGTHVIIQTKSQWFIYGDMFDLYNQLIQDFLRDLRIEVGCVDATGVDV